MKHLHITEDAHGRKWIHKQRQKTEVEFFGRYWNIRYTFVTTITLTNDVKLENVLQMLGHTNTRMTLHYAHIMNESLAQEMNKVAAIMGE